MKRYAQNSRMVLESPRLPAPSQLNSVYQSLSNMPATDLAGEYAALQRALRSAAIQAGKIRKSEADKKQSFVDISKEQMVEELMLEYLKKTLGKPTPLGKQSSLFSPATSP
jgi:3-deoxy-D-arabino-heptulosonate 7-phosphate (DAHP) synthase class II